MSEHTIEPVEDLEMPNAWERREREPKKAYLAFRDYCRMGPGRSLAKLAARYRTEAEAGPAQPPTQRLATLKAWSARDGWQGRVEAWDAAQNEAEQALWDQRRREIREQDWALGTELRDLAAQILQEGPSFVKTRRRLIKGNPATGERDREVVIMALDGAFLVKAAELSSKLQRLAAGMPDSHQAISGAVETVGAEDMAAVRAEMEAWERGCYGADAADGHPDGAPTGA